MTEDPTRSDSRPLAERITGWPVSDGDTRAEQEFERIRREAGALPGDGELVSVLEQDAVRLLVTGIIGGSPYLTSLIRRDPARLGRLLGGSPEAVVARRTADFTRDADAAISTSEIMRVLRTFKADIALLTALADLGDVWPVMTVTETLTQVADAALAAAVRFLFRDATRRGDWLPAKTAQPELGSGYFVLGMGKYGAGELNYSSDIDLIVFFDLAKSRLRPALEPQTFFVRLTRDLIKLMQERTVDGYVFRTDLRLRPDPGATQIALSVDAALGYYEAVGQNWERAAMIKARAVAGDVVAGAKLLADLAPFIWRRYLDFAAIADIHAMKRQIHAFRGFGAIAVAGHNIKLGRGGIREIEFFAQTQQLIAGGRQSDLRLRGTLATLDRLAEREWIEPEVARQLSHCYVALRRIEHRIQMMADEQSHELPSAPDALAKFARFCGYSSLESFSTMLVATLETVQRHYAALFETSPELTSGGVNMVFAGGDDDPATVTALANLGYQQPKQVLAAIRSWHHGRTPSVRSPAARERLTDMQPLLVAALADTADPDRAFASFDRFLSELPAGVQLFSLLHANPGLLRLLADIMGTAPRLARILSQRRRLLDAVIDPRTFGEVLAREELDALLHSELDVADDIEGRLNQARIVGSEQSFLIGVRVLTGSINAARAGEQYALLADRLIAALQCEVERELVRSHGQIPQGEACVVALGKLGGREMTAASDLDLIVVYDFAPGSGGTDGERSLEPAQYYTRLTQRLIAALSAPTAEGALYDVDLRLRPSGQKGPLATRLQSFVTYQTEEAWTWEHMALTRARVITGPLRLRKLVTQAIGAVLVMARDPIKIAADVREMRALISKQKGTTNIWDLKQVRGGMVDLEFIAQYLQLVHAARTPEVLDQNTIATFEKLRDAGCLNPAEAAVLIDATRLVHDLTQILRLCIAGSFEPATAPQGLKDMLARAGDAPTFDHLQASLRQTLATVAELFERLVPNRDAA